MKQQKNAQKPASSKHFAFGLKTISKQSKTITEAKCGEGLTQHKPLEAKCGDGA